MGNSLHKLHNVHNKISSIILPNKSEEINKIIKNIQEYKNKKFLFFDRYKKEEKNGNEVYTINKNEQLRKVKKSDSIFSKLTSNNLNINCIIGGKNLK